MKGQDGHLGNGKADACATLGKQQQVQDMPLGIQLLSPTSLQQRDEPPRRMLSKRPPQTFDPTPTVPAPELSRTQLAEILVSSVTEVADGFDKKRRGAPLTPQDKIRLKQLDDQVAAAWDLVRTQQGLLGESEALASWKLAKRRRKDFLKQSRVRFIGQKIHLLHTALNVHDWGSFYKVRREVGVSMEGLSFEGSAPFSPQQLRDHNMKVSENALPVDTAYIAQQVPQRPICYELGSLPTRAEFNECLQSVKESSPGKDGVTAHMLRKAGARVHEQLYRIVCDMFVLPASEWDQLLTEGLGVSIFKGDGNRMDLDNYRTTTLLPILSRLLGRILSVRVMEYAEKCGLLFTFQWGNRKHRSVQDALFVVRTIAELAAEVACAPCNNIELESALTLVFFDVRKSFPSVNRQAAFFLFQRLGFPPSLLQVLGALLSGTRYYATTAGGFSQEYCLASGFREGCCTSPGFFMTVLCRTCEDKLYRIDKTTQTSKWYFILCSVGLSTKGSMPPIDLAFVFSKTRQLLFAFLNFLPLCLQTIPR